MSPAQVGQATGSIAGAAIIPGVGAPLGALVGTLAGLLIEGQVDKSRERKERSDLGGRLKRAPDAAGGAASDAAAFGTPTRVWVDEQFQGGRLTPGHFEVRPIP